jgi:hypothetical protein
MECDAMKKHFSILFAAGLLFGSVQISEAATIVVNAADFAAYTTGAVVGDFSSVPLPSCSGTACFGGANPLTGSSLQGVSFSTPNLNGNVNVNSAGFNGSNDLSVPYAVNSVFDGSLPDTIVITLPAATTAFGLNFNTLFTSTTETFTLSNGFSTSVSPTPNINSGGPNLQFIGFISDDPFTTIILSVPNDQSLVVADFTTADANVPAVPESSTWAMIIMGFAGVGFIARRRRQGGIAFRAAS